jgi:RNA ligase
MLIHPAHTVSVSELLEQIEAARANRLIYERQGPDGLRLYVYSIHCVYEGAWTLPTIAARGLIVDTANKQIIATPFPKFFNLGERGEPAPDLAFRAYEKLDGSLIVIYHHDGRWRTATKGSFDSPQAQWAEARLHTHDLTALRPGTTYLAEGIYPENRIVVRYEEAALVLLAAYDGAGVELSHEALEEVAARLGVRMARTYDYAGVHELVTHAKTLPRSEEGFVVRFINGHRLKIKGDEYKRIHSLISNVTPLALWEAMQAGADLDAIKLELPDEFMGDFDQIVQLLERSLSSLVERTQSEIERIKEWSDKEVGLGLKTFDPEIQGLIFDVRKSGGKILESRARRKVFERIRPTGNELPGYTPSHAMYRALTDDS